MLVDTGAYESVLDEHMILDWGLVYTGSGWAGTISGTKPIRSYEIKLTIRDGGGLALLAIDPLTVGARQSPFAGLPYRGLLGRDVLSRCLFTYDGPGHQCTLEF